MSPPEGASLHDTQQIADELRTGRDALLNLARDVSESRIYRVTARTCSMNCAVARPSPPGGSTCAAGSPSRCMR